MGAYKNDQATMTNISYVDKLIILKNEVIKLKEEVKELKKLLRKSKRISDI